MWEAAEDRSGAGGSQFVRLQECERVGEAASEPEVPAEITAHFNIDNTAFFGKKVPSRTSTAAEEKLVPDFRAQADSGSRLMQLATLSRSRCPVPNFCGPPHRGHWVSSTCALGPAAVDPGVALTFGSYHRRNGFCRAAAAMGGGSSRGSGRRKGKRFPVLDAVKSVVAHEPSDVQQSSGPGGTLWQCRFPPSGRLGGVRSSGWEAAADGHSSQTWTQGQAAAVS